MTRGRLRTEWDRTSHVMALLANAHRDSKKCRRPYRPQDFHPIKEKQQLTASQKKANFSILKAAFVGKEKSP